MKKWFNASLVVCMMLALLAGCSTNSNKNSNTTESSPPASEPAKQDDANSEKEAESAWPRTVKDDAGNDVVLKEQPKKIAVLHPLYLDYFYALDTPAAASSHAAEAFAEYATLQPYAENANVIDLGNSREVNLESLIEISPDLIVTFKGSVDKNYEELIQIAPVFQVEYSNSWDESTMLIAQVIGKEQLAEQLIEETKQMIADAKEKMGEIKNKTFALLRVAGNGTFSAQGTKNTNYYNDETGFGLGVPKGYPEDSAQLSIEALSDMNPDYIIIQHKPDAAEKAVKENEGSGVWQAMNAAKNNHILMFDNSFNSGSVLAVRGAAEKFIELDE